MSLKNEKFEVNQWLAGLNYYLPKNINEYPAEAIVPFYRAKHWKEKGYISVGSVITYLDSEFGPFWQKVILTKQEKSTKQQITFKNKEQFVDNLYHYLREALSCIGVCIQVCSENEKDDIHDIGVVLEHARRCHHRLLDLYECFDDLEIARKISKK